MCYPGGAAGLAGERRHCGVNTREQEALVRLANQERDASVFALRAAWSVTVTAHEGHAAQNQTQRKEESKEALREEAQAACGRRSTPSTPA